MRPPRIDDLRLWHVTVAVQYFAGAVLLLVPVGFDHPSSWGLDFDHLLLMGLLFAFFTLIAVLCAIAEKSVIGFLIAAAPVYGPFLARWL